MIQQHVKDFDAVPGLVVGGAIEISIYYYEERLAIFKVRVIL